jgi:hypothetical protein
MMAIAGLLLALFAVFLPPAAAQPAPKGGPSVRGVASTEAHADYQLYTRGFRVAHLEVGYDLAATNYRMEVAYRTFGLVGFLFHGRQLSSVAGGWNGSTAVPAQYVGDGYWRGGVHRTILDYTNGVPKIREQIPSNEEDDREEVPAAQLPGAIDALSAITEMMRVATATGRCELALRTYDGRRLIQLTARTAGYEELAPTDRSVFTGRALRCNFTGRLVAGFRSNDSATERTQSRGGSAWLAQVVPGASLLPVKMVFETAWFGDATMYLTASGPGSARNAPTD